MYLSLYEDTMSYALLNRKRQCEPSLFNFDPIAGLPMSPRGCAMEIQAS